MKKKKRITLTILLTIPISIISLVAMTNDLQNNYEKLSQTGNLIAMYIEDEDGEYKVSNSSKFPTNGYSLNLEMSTCKNGGVLSQDSTTKLISLSTSFNDTCTLYFAKESPKFSLEEIIASSNGVRLSFQNVATTDEGIFEMEDDYGTSYYYRGAVTNNHVKFGKNKNGQDMYWRIIRINGDGSMRIIYSGTQAYVNGRYSTDMFIGSSQFNLNNDDAKYVGWMYEPEGTTASTSKEQAQTNTVDSYIKTYVDNWYKENIVDTGYSNAVADVLFCNDRSTPGKTVTGWNSDTAKGYKNFATAYGAYARDANTSYPTPEFKCPQKNDAFTVSDTTKGNGALTYPVGLITADEIVAAGSGKFNTANKSYYLYRPSYWYWTFSPYTLGGTGESFLFVATATGSLYINDVKLTGSVAPVINLSAEYVATMIGDGTMENPYST